MTDPRTYIRRETAISVLISMTISAGFFLMLFGVADQVPVRGLGGYAVDFLPQTFMVGLMGALVPSLLTRKRIASGAIAAILAPSLWPRAVLPRSALMALFSALVIGGGAMAILAVLSAATIPWTSALAIKVVVGGLVAAIVTPAAIRATLAAA
jgi:hypothetical protein